MQDALEGAKQGDPGVREKHVALVLDNVGNKFYTYLHLTPNKEPTMEMTGDITSDAFPAFCREHGLKCTAQRLAVFNTVRLSRWHPSVDETLAEVRKTVPTVARDSVYRILNEFATWGLSRGSMRFRRHGTIRFSVRTRTSSAKCAGRSPTIRSRRSNCSPKECHVRDTILSCASPASATNAGRESRWIAAV